MDWSKVKQKVESRFATSLRGRLTINLTRYRKSSADHLYEFWFSFDGRKLHSVSDGQFYEAVYDRTTGQRADWDETELATPSGFESKRLVEGSLNLPIDALVQHEHPVVRALGIVDARFGERRLKMLSVAGEHPIVADLARLRAQAEGLRLVGEIAI